MYGDDQEFQVLGAWNLPSETWKNCWFSSKTTWNSLEFKV